MKWSGSSDSVKRIAYVRHFANVRYMHTVKCIIGAEPGRTGLCFGVYARTSAFLKPPFYLPPRLVKCTLILWLFVIADRAHQVLLSSLHILAEYIGRLHDAAVLKTQLIVQRPDN